MGPTQIVREMDMELFKENTLMQAMLMAALASGLAACGSDGDDGADGTNGTDGQSGVVLKRLASAPIGAEFTGMFLNTDGTFFMNVQHPSTSNDTADSMGKTFDKGTVGVIVGSDFNNLGQVAELDLAITDADKEVVTVATGKYQVVLQQGDAMVAGF